jgi:hypothetical protein
MNGTSNHGLAQAMIKDRQQEARRAGERARSIAEARAAARDDQTSVARPGTGVTRRVRALLRAPAV